MKELKKHHHYVWKEYLKPWETNGSIYCSRKDKVFKTSLNNIAQERFFYSSIELGEREIKFLEYVIKSVNETSAKSMSFILKLYNNISTSKKQYDIKCGIEDLHTDVENYGKESLFKLQQGNIEFIKNDKLKHRLSLFLGVQYMRTNKMRKNLIGDVFNTFEAEKLTAVMPFIYGEIIGHWIYNYGKIKLLENNTSKNFISSDQPIFNILGPTNYNDKPEKFELFYPITPNLAIYISKEDKNIDIKNISDVIIYNEKITAHSFEQIFAKNKIDFK